MGKILFGREDYEKFEEKDKLRFVIASFKRCKKYYSCDTKCPLELVEKDENFEKVISFVKKYNLSSDDLANLIDIYLRKKIRKYLGKHRGNLFIDLKEIIELYQLK